MARFYIISPLTLAISNEFLDPDGRVKLTIEDLSYRVTRNEPEHVQSFLSYIDPQRLVKFLDDNAGNPLLTIELTQAVRQRLRNLTLEELGLDIEDAVYRELPRRLTDGTVHTEES